MALSTYTELKAAIADYLVDDDLVTQIPDFIRLAEARFQRKLRIRQMERQDTLYLIDGLATVQLPTGFVEARSVLLHGAQDSVLEYRTPTQLNTDHLNDTSGTPKAYTIIGSNFHFAPAPSGDVTATITMYAKVDPLSDTTTTNPILDDAPDLYLYGALMEASPFLGDDDRTMIWVQLFDRAVNDIKEVDEAIAWSSGPLVARHEHYMP